MLLYMKEQLAFYINDIHTNGQENKKACSNSKNIHILFHDQAPCGQDAKKLNDKEK